MLREISRSAALFGLILYSALAQPSSLSLQTSSSIATYGAPVTLTATVTPLAATGKVTFYAGVAVLGVVPVSSGSAVLATPLLPAGTLSLRAYYSGDSSHSPASSPSVSQIVQAAAAGGFVWSQSALTGFAVHGVVADFNGDGKSDFAGVTQPCGCVTIQLGRGDGSFVTGVTLRTASSTTPLTGPLVAADFNGDGNVDLAVSMATQNQIAMFFGNGDGSFQTSASYLAAADATGLVVSDFNHDGNPDIAFASGRVPSGNTVISQIGVLLGKGDGTFSALPPINIETSPLLAAGDFDGDGNPDLAVANGSPVTGAMRILWGNGDGTFSVFVAGTIPFIASPFSIAAGDFNGDGIDDVSVMLVSSSWLHLDAYLGSKARLPVVAESLPPGSSQFMVRGDFDGNGILDLVTEAGLLLGNGDGTFHEAASLNLNYLPGGSTDAVSGDFNSDGREDLILLGDGAVLVTGVGPADLTVAVQRSSGSLFQGMTGVPYTVTVQNLGPSPDTGAVELDIMGSSLTFSSASGTGWTCLSATGLERCFRSGPLAVGQSFPAISILANVSLTAPGQASLQATVSSPGDPNTANNTASDTASVAQQQSIIFGTLADRPFSSTPFSIAATASSGLAVTFSGSGTCAVAGNTVTMMSTGVCTIAADQTGNSAWLPAPTVTRSFHILAGGASVLLTASSDHSLLGMGVSLTAAVSPATATGKITFFDGSTVLGTSGISGGSAVLSVALQATGNRSLVARYSGDSTLPASTSPALRHMVSTLPNAGYQSTTLNLGQLSTVRALKTGDFNGDGRIDVVVAALTSVTVLPGIGDGTFGAGIVTTISGGRLSQIIAGDFDADGKLDLAASFLPINGNLTLAILFGNGDGTFRSPVTVTPSLGTFVAVADLNNDAFPDLVVANIMISGTSAPPSISVFLNKGDGSFNPPLSFSLPAPNVSGSFPALGAAVGDLDGDGNLDIVTVSPQVVPSNGRVASVFTLLFGNGDGTFRGAQSLQATNQPGFLNIDDLNGDGHPDLVMGGGPVTIFLGDGSGGFSAPTSYAAIDPSTLAAFSSAPYAALAGDFNGDGREDVAEVFSNGFAIVLEIFPGAGDGTLQRPAATKYSLSLEPLTILAADFNGDGRMDVLLGQTMLTGASAPVPHMPKGHTRPVRRDHSCIRCVPSAP